MSTAVTRLIRVPVLLLTFVAAFFTTSLADAAPIVVTTSFFDYLRVDVPAPAADFADFAQIGLDGRITLTLDVTGLDAGESLHVLTAEYVGGIVIPRELFESVGGIYLPMNDVALPTPIPTLYITLASDIAAINANGFSVFLYLSGPVGGTAELNGLTVSGVDVNRNPITVDPLSTSAPEPTSLMLLATGMAAVAARMRRRRIVGLEES